MPLPIQKLLNQELLSLYFEDHNHEKSIEIINRQIELSSDSLIRFDYEIKKLTPLLVLGRVDDAASSTCFLNGYEDFAGATDVS